MWGVKAPTPPKVDTTDIRALKERMSGGLKARPELHGACHKEKIDNSSYAKDDIVFTETQMRRKTKKLIAEGFVPPSNAKHYHPAEYWDDVYRRNKLEYYETKYGANNSCNQGLFCVKCENTNCGWNWNEIPLFINNVCPNCQTLPIGLFQTPNPRKRSRVPEKTRLLELAELIPLRAPLRDE
jgi:hypothetical protein